MKTTWKSKHENDGLSKYGSRDTVGYGEKTPKPKWPNGAKVAINFVINYEEGGERCLLHGDNESENLLSEIAGAEAYGTFDLKVSVLSRTNSRFYFFSDDAVLAILFDQLVNATPTWKACMIMGLGLAFGDSIVFSRREKSLALSLPLAW